nr:reverse transcriptase domain-containing protein [Tanacetum cinerariifolium]
MQRSPRKNHRLSHSRSVRREECSSEKSQVIIKEVVEWLKVGIVRSVKYPTWTSNPVLVKKGAEAGEYA